MVKGKPWPVDKEQRLRELVASSAYVAKIAATLGKSKDARWKKCSRLVLEVVGAVKITQTTSKLDLSADLPSVEEALKMLNAALKALGVPRLDKSGTLRLRILIHGVRIYKELLANYINYRAIEAKLVDLEAKYARVLQEKAKGNVS